MRSASKFSIRPDLGHRLSLLLEFVLNHSELLTFSSDLILALSVESGREGARIVFQLFKEVLIDHVRLAPLSLINEGQVLLFNEHTLIHAAAEDAPLLCAGGPLFAHFHAGFLVFLRRAFAGLLLLFLNGEGGERTLG